MQKLTREDMQSIKGGMASGWTIWACLDDGGTDYVCYGADPTQVCGYQGCSNTLEVCYVAPGCIH